MNILAHSEPHQLSAGFLALVVHSVFFSMLYLSFNWHVKVPQGVQVDMWASLPEPTLEIAPIPVAPPPVVAPQVEKAVVAKPVVPVVPKADIELKEKNSKKLPEKKKEPSPLKETPTSALGQAGMDKQRAAEQQAERENDLIQERKERMRAEMDAATQSEVARFKEMIQAKISRNIVMPPDVPENAVAKFKVIVLPGGSVADVKLLKSSGNLAYDSAGERAIYKAQPLPMPQDAGIARLFRELQLSVKP